MDRCKEENKVIKKKETWGGGKGKEAVRDERRKFIIKYLLITDR
jgi:hypothetical protein